MRILATILLVLATRDLGIASCLLPLPCQTFPVTACCQLHRRSLSSELPAPCYEMWRPLACEQRDWEASGL